MLSVEDWAEIRRLHRAEGLPIKVIARVLGISKNTVKAALASDGPPKYERPPRGSVVDEVEPRIRELLQAYPRMPATVIAEQIGWTRSIRVLSARVAELRPVYLPPDPASRTAYAAGEIAQCDLWFPPVQIPVGFGQTRTATRLPVLTMISAYSRWLMAILIPTRRAEDLFAGWWELICRMGTVPRAGGDQGDTSIGECLDRLQNVQSVASQAVELPDHHGVAFADVVHQGCQAWAVVFRARHGVGERLGDACCGKGGILLIQSLGNGANSRVSHPRSAVRS
jgi:hypothetical protein